MLREIAIALSAGRVALGAGLVAAPGPIASAWIGELGARPGAKALARALGVRDVVLGAGAATALLNDSDEAAVWLAGSAAADLVDLGATVAARQDLPPSGVAVTVLLAGASALLCTAAAAEERR